MASAGARELTKLQRENERLEREVLHERKKVESAEKEVKELKYSAQEQEQSMATLRKALFEANKDSGKNSKVTEKYHQLLKDRDTLEAALKEKDRLHQGTIANTTATIANWVECEKDWESSKAALHMTITELENHRTSLRAELASLKQDLASSSTSAKTASNDLHRHMQQSATVETQLRLAETRITELQSRLTLQEEDFSSQVRSITCEVEDKDATLKETQKKEVQALAMVRQMSADLQGAMTEKEDLQKGLRLLQTRCDTREADGMKTQEDMVHVQLELQNCQKQLTLERQAAVDFRARYQSAQEELVEKGDQIRSQGENQREYLEQQNTLWAELQAAKSQGVELEALKQDHLEKIATLSSDLSARDRTIASATREFTLQKDACLASEERLQANLVALQSALDAEKRKTSTLEDLQKTRTESLSVAASNYTKLNQTIDEKTIELARVRCEMNQAERSVASITKELTDSEMKWAAKDAEFSSSITQWEAKETESKKQMCALQGRVSQLESALNEKTEHCSSSEQSQKELQEQLEIQGKKHDEMRLLARQYEIDLTSKVEEFHSLENSLHTTQNELVEAKFTVQQAREVSEREKEAHRLQLKDSQAGYASIKVKLLEEETCRKRLEVELREADAEAEKHSQKLSTDLQLSEDRLRTTMNDVESLQVELCAAETITSELRACTELLGADKVKLEVSLLKEIEMKAELQRQVAKLEIVTAELTEDLQKAHTALTQQHQQGLKPSEKVVLKSEEELGALRVDYQTLQFEHEREKQSAQVQMCTLQQEQKRHAEYKEAHRIVVERLTQSDTNRKEESRIATRLIQRYRSEKRVLSEKFDKLKVMFEELRDDAALAPSSRNTKRAVAFAQVCNDAEAQALSQSQDTRPGVLQDVEENQEPPFKKARHEV